MGKIRSREFVSEFTIPALEEYSFLLRSWFPVVFCNDPIVRTLNTGPGALAMAVLNGPNTSSDCLIVGDVVIWSVVSGSTTKWCACMHSRYIVFAAPLATIRYCFLTSRFFTRFLMYRPGFPLSGLIYTSLSVNSYQPYTSSAHNLKDGSNSNGEPSVSVSSFSQNRINLSVASSS